MKQCVKSEKAIKVPKDKNKARPPYNPKTDDNAFKAWHNKDQAYLCAFYHKIKKRELALALGRTYGAVCQRAKILKCQGLFNYYKKMYEEMEFDL